MICASIFAGPQFNFGSGPRIWIDNLDSCEGVLDEFKAYFENEAIKKVWHNYSFDRHVLFNHGINVKGFGGDTMQMARLWDSSRTMSGGYSLKSLTSDTDLQLPVKPKKTITERFGGPKIKKDGTPGKIIEVPPFSRLQREPQFVTDWIEYSVLDAECTWYLRDALQRELMKMWWKKNLSMWDFYIREWLEFGELLTEMEREGIRVDLQHLKKIQQIAERDSETKKNLFLEWAKTKCEDAKYMNIESDVQLQQFLFSPAYDAGTGTELLPGVKEFKTLNTEGFIEPGFAKFFI